ncbi:MAG: sulfurtransferase TusA family protein, partial [Alphaproteobacteria bacterium]|nr:sulfurtransferase TusA family protein [Alphaproteobacteria bacterium]
MARCRFASPFAHPRTLMPSAEILVDARGLRCPWPVLRAAKAIRQSSGHETIRVIADD